MQLDLERKRNMLQQVRQKRFMLLNHLNNETTGNSMLLPTGPKACKEPPKNVNSINSDPAKIPSYSLQLLSDDEIERITKFNTNQNATVNCSLKTIIIKKNTVRPPSPSSKLFNRNKVKLWDENFQNYDIANAALSRGQQYEKSVRWQFPPISPPCSNTSKLNLNSISIKSCLRSYTDITRKSKDTQEFNHKPPLIFIQRFEYLPTPTVKSKNNKGRKRH